MFHDPDKLKSGRTRAKLTKEAADKFQTISDSLQHRNPDREAVAHFINQLVFCFFADSVGLLPNGVWKKLLETSARKPDKSKQWIDRLFADMKDGGDFNLEDIAQFNGGLFDGRAALALQHTEIGLLFAAASLDWGLIDPTIFGTLFERFLDPDKRAQIGAHYTDPEKIMMIVEPVVARPLRREWETAKARIEAIMAPVLAASGGGGKAASRDLGKRFDAARAKAEAERDLFIDRLCALRILDPACGSGNFLYLALQAVKDIEYRAILECETLGLGMIVPRVGPEILRGIEINPFAAELARTTIWIGDIQWRVKNAITHHPRPILRKLDTIECRDALLTPDGKGGFVEAEWPEADYIVGNPPFLGGKLLRRGLGDANVETLFRSLFAPRTRRSRFRLLLVCQGVGRVASGTREARRARVDELDPRRRQPQGAGADRAKRARFSKRGATRRGRSRERRCGCRWFALERAKASFDLMPRWWTAFTPTSARNDQICRTRDDCRKISMSLLWATPKVVLSTSMENWRARGSRSRSTPTADQTATF